MLHRTFTRLELIFFVAAAERVRDQVDAELGELLLRVARGDDSALAAAHDRLNVLGNFAGADRLRKLITEP